MSVVLVLLPPFWPISVTGPSGRCGWLQAKLDRLYDNGILRKGDIDSYTMDALTALTSDLADCAMNRFCEANFSRITNKSGFLMGIIRRVQVDWPLNSISALYIHLSVRDCNVERIEITGSNAIQSGRHTGKPRPAD